MSLIIDLFGLWVVAGTVLMLIIMNSYASSDVTRLTARELMADVLFWPIVLAKLIYEKMK